MIVVETTWRGGRGGHLWDIVRKALETPEEEKHADDWRVVFFPWQDDPACCDAVPQLLKEETVRYFSDKPGFSNGQKSWYQKARDQLEVSEVLCLGSVYFLRSAPILPRRGSAPAVPPEPRGYGGA
ncbi:MAG TPA: hypothetical protein VIT23_10915 [Terrimicrobiaceae bacterium]